VRHLILTAAVLLGWATNGWAQTEGRVSIGGSVTFNQTPADGVDNALSIGPLIRLNPRPGWGPAGALNWFEAELRNPGGGDADFAELRVRPLMAGVSYTVPAGTRTLVSFSIVAGPSFNRAKFDEDIVTAGMTIDAENSLAVRPGVGVTWTVARRVAVVGFGGYLINRPDIVLTDGGGGEITQEWTADSIVLSVGLVYSLF
jgi:hypothetical protein